MVPETDGHHDDTELEQGGDCPECGGENTLYYEPWIRGGTEREFRNGDTGGIACMNCSFTHQNEQADPLEADPVQCREDDCTTENPPVLMTKGRCDECARKQAHKERWEARRDNFEQCSNNDCTTEVPPGELKDGQCQGCARAEHYKEVDKNREEPA